MIIISIDPQVKESAGTFHWHESGNVLKPCAVGMFDTQEFIKNHAQIMWDYMGSVTGYNKFLFCQKIAIIEGQYVGLNRKGSLNLCKVANQMAGALIANGFEYYEAPVFSGNKSWLYETFSLGGKPQDRETINKLSMAAAKEIWPGVANDHEAMAINMAQWWWSKYRQDRIINP